MADPRHDRPADLGADRTAARDTDRAATQVRHQLEERGVRVHDDDPPGMLAEMLSSVEEFERAVARRGGDSFTNTPQSSDPDREDFVVPMRGDDESAEAYARRVSARARDIAPGGV
ncbi:MAG TPA: hypothetical protein VFX39_00365 [Gemmatimonadaceae bacterium]|nr:hypothetical protein [Gemmatimonadaceae bacterium]